MSRYAPSVALALVVAALVLGAAPPAALDPVRRGKEAAALIEKLGSEDFDERQKAAAELGGREDALGQLEAAAASEDAEVRKRARALVSKIKGRIKARKVRWATELLEQGEVGLFVERFVSKGKALTDDDWEVPLAFARQVVEAADKVGGKGPPIDWGKARKPVGKEPDIDWEKMRKHPVLFTKDIPGARNLNNKRVCAEAVSYERAGGSLFVTRGEFTTEQELQDAVLIANGPVRLSTKKWGRPYGSVVICDGDVEVNADVLGCVIIAGGDVRIASRVMRCVILAGGTVRHSLAEKKEYAPLESYLNGGEKSPLGLVRFTDLARLGLEVATADGRVVVKAVAQRGPFAAAGVKAGDVLLGVNGEKAGDIGMVLRACRRAQAEGTALTLGLRRGSESVSVKVELAWAPR